MKLATEFGLWRRGRPCSILATVLAVQTVVIVGIVASERATRRAEEARMRFALNREDWWLDNPTKPILRPPVMNAAEASIRPEEVVIGVEVGGKARAYRLSALDDPSRHLVNDLIGDMPVLVTYCNLSHCLRVFTGPRGTAPLDIEAAGLLNGEMVIKLKGISYFQMSGKPVEPAKSPPAIPYSRLNPTLTSWEAWRRLHPETDVYEGELASETRRKRPSKNIGAYQRVTRDSQTLPMIPKRD